ncbi:MAG: phytanoyl-CoA dioxygenase family protein [Pseudomonadota bacterium]
MRTLVRELTYSRPFAWFVLFPALWAGVVVFNRTGRTPWFAYWAMRRLYCITRGRSNRWLVRRLASPPAGVGSPVTGVLSGLGEAERDGALTALRRDGFVVLGRRLTDAQIESLIEFARSTPARLMPTPVDGPLIECFDPERPRAIKYDLPEQALVEHPVVQELLADKSLRDLARRYLGYEPINDLVAMWWSTAYSSQPSAEVAQLYHFDMDRPQFLKLFFYLTDVTSDTGPHCYVRASHRERPAPLWRDGRHTDDEVLRLHGADSEVEITAPRGSLIAVDTSGFHKGKPLARGHRLILQLEYTSALFGQEYTRIEVPASAFWRAEIAASPVFMTRFSVARSARVLH